MNNSGFVSIKFNLISFLISTLVENVLFQRLFSFKTFLTKFSKETLTVHFYFSVIFRKSRDQTKQTLAVTFLF